MSKNKFSKFTPMEESSPETENTTETSILENSGDSLEIAEVSPEVSSSTETTKEESAPAAEETIISKVTEKTNTVNEQPSTKKKGFTPVYKVEFALNNYMEAMDVTKPIDPNEGARWQYSLLATIKEVLDAPTQEEFNKEWNTILNFFNVNSKVPALTENFVFRFPSEWVGSQTEYKIFQHLVYLIINTCNPQTRKKNIQDINLEIMTEGLSQEQKNKLINFYLM